MSDDFDDQEGEGGAAATAIPAPRENPNLVGQEAAEAALLDAYRSGRLPHAWLLTGPRGIGKATLAFRFARFLLAQTGDGPGLFGGAPDSLAIDPNHPAFRRIAASGHADLLLVEKAYDEKRKRYRSEIVVDDVRDIADFLHLTPAEGGWRIVIVDGADEMNRNAANALLKVLEEPPRQAMLLITSANRGRLLPTLRSRCRHLELARLADSQVAELIRKYLPSQKQGEVAELVRLAGGSIGRAIDLAQANGLALHRELMALLAGLPNIDGATLDAFADRVARRGAEVRFQLLAEFLPAWVARQASGQAGQEVEARPIARRPSPRPGVDRWLELWEKLNRLFALVDFVNLDRKQVVLNAFFALEEASR
jgi:DNA polymerase III subunit delta'